MKYKSLAVTLVFLALPFGSMGARAQQDNEYFAPESRAMVIGGFSGGGSRLGVQVRDITAKSAGEFKLSGEYGALVTQVEEGSAAEKAGLKANDVILEFDGERVRSAAELRRLLAETPPDRTVGVKISRDGRFQNLKVTAEGAAAREVMPHIDMHPVEIPQINIPNFHFDFFPGPSRLGISGEELNPQLAKYFGVAAGKGVLVLEVESGSAAEKAGLKAGDCIIRAGSDAVENLGDLRRALDFHSSQPHEVALAIVRDRREQTVSVHLEPAAKALPDRVAQSRMRHEARIRQLWRPVI